MGMPFLPKMGLRKWANVAVSVCLLLLVLPTNVAKAAQGDDECGRRTTCGECMGNAECVWCLDNAQEVNIVPRCFRRDSDGMYSALC